MFSYNLYIKASFGFIFLAVFDHKPQNVEEEPNGCNCVGYTCGCCQHLEVDKIGLNDTGKSYKVEYSMSYYFRS